MSTSLHLNPENIINSALPFTTVVKKRQKRGHDTWQLRMIKLDEINIKIII